MFDYNKFVDDIIALRKEKGYSQTSLAKELGCTKQVIQKIESKAQFLRMNTVQKLAQVLDFDIAIIPKDTEQK